MRTLLLVTLALLLCAAPSYAGGQWSSQPDENTAVIPNKANWGANAYYRFTDATDSTWMSLIIGPSYEICLDSDIAGTGGSTTITIRRAISGSTTVGSYVLENKVLTGLYPLACLEKLVPGGREIQVVVATAPNSTTAVVSVEGH